MEGGCIAADDAERAYGGNKNYGIYTAFLTGGPDIWILTFDIMPRVSVAHRLPRSKALT
jgi:hypothetical protein